MPTDNWFIDKYLDSLGTKATKMPPKPKFKRYFSKKPDGQLEKEAAESSSTPPSASTSKPTLSKPPAANSFDSGPSAPNLSVYTSELSNGAWAEVKSKQKQGINPTGSSLRGQHSKQLPLEV
jgi:hypothetical protein